MAINDIIIFTDGASQGNPGPGGWGVIVACPPKNKSEDPDCEDIVTEIGGHDDKTTNNRMELKAAIEALRALGDSKGDVAVHTDSSYVMQGITKWVKGWTSQHWLTATKKPVLNKDLWQELIDLEEYRKSSGLFNGNSSRVMPVFREMKEWILSPQLLLSNACWTYTMAPVQNTQLIY